MLVCYILILSEENNFLYMSTDKILVHFFFVSKGKYMYIEASSWSTGNNAKLQLAVPRGESSTSCLTFFYHMYGSSMGTLNVFNGNSKIFTKSGNQGYYWKKVTRTLQLSDVVSKIGIFYHNSYLTCQLFIVKLLRKVNCIGKKKKVLNLDNAFA